MRDSSGPRGPQRPRGPERNIPREPDRPPDRREPRGPQPPGPRPRPPQPGLTPGAASTTGATTLASLNDRWGRLAGKLSLGDQLGQLEDLTSDISKLSTYLSELRTRGFRYGLGWEERVETLQSRWTSQSLDARRVLDDRAAALRSAGQQVEWALQRGQREAASLSAAESQIAQLEQQVSRAEQDVRASYGSTRDEASALGRDLKEVLRLLDALDTAQFKLYPDEYGVAACKAQWLDKGEEPEGLLYLTDGRVVFEQKETKRTKVLFFTKSSETVHRLLFDAPVGAIDLLEANDTGGVLGIGSKELLTLHFTTPPKNAPADITLQLKDGARNEEWAALIRRVQTGQIAAELYTPPSSVTSAEAAAAATPSAPIPTVCPACGATLPAAVKGMRQLTCQYCGRSVSL
ncbi:MAG: hypothetical protein GX557_00365 [Chloroflexi bacterium]|nr:hypothetical protein [Chloroflexota bacterium]